MKSIKFEVDEGDYVQIAWIKEAKVFSVNIRDQTQIILSHSEMMALAETLQTMATYAGEIRC